MSAGAFVRTLYESEYGAGGAIHPILLQPETLLATDGTNANDAPAGPADSPISAQVSTSRRGNGLHPRIVYLKLTGTPPTGYAIGSKARIPVLQSTTYFAWATIGTVITYLGTTWQVTGFDAEIAR